MKSNIRFFLLALTMTAALLIIPSARPVRCSQEDPQCAFLKDMITKPKDKRQKDSRDYFCRQMQEKGCSEYKTLCEDSKDSSPNKDSSPISELGKWRGTWSGTYKNSLEKTGTSSITFEEGKDGKITGNEDGVKINDYVTITKTGIKWKYKVAGSCRIFEGNLTLGPDGETATGSYDATGCKDNYDGTYRNYKKK